MFVSLITSFYNKTKLLSNLLDLKSNFGTPTPHINVWKILDYHGLKPLLVDNLNESLYWDFVKISPKPTDIELSKRVPQLRVGAHFEVTSQGYLPR